MYEKKDNEITTIALFLLAFGALEFILAKWIIKMAEKEKASINETYTNVKVQNLKAYVPEDWNTIGDFRVSPSGNCKTIGATTNHEQNVVERNLLGTELEHKNITLNNTNISYGYKNNGTEKMYSYYLTDNKYNYIILFINKAESDEECNKYPEKLEQSIILEKEN